jgi:hypothetical protein
LTGRPERKLLAENADLKIARYVAQIESCWPLPKTYWFGLPEMPDVDEAVAEIEYDWQMRKREFGL